MKMTLNRRPGRSVLTLLAVLALLGSGCGEIIELTFEQIVKRWDDGFKGAKQFSDDKQRIISVVGKGTKAYRGSPREMASEFLDENRKMFGIKDKLADLRVITEVVREFGTNVEFQQFWNGLPVENGTIQINFDKDGHVVQVENSYTPPATVLDKINVIKERAAEVVVNDFLRTTLYFSSKGDQQQSKPSGKPAVRDELTLAEPPKVEDVYFARDGRLQRSYRISINSYRPFGSKQFVIDADSGEILQSKNFIYNFVDGQGRVFNPNPVNSLNKPELFEDGEFTVVPKDDPKAYFTVQLAGLQAADVPFPPRGPFVALEEIECNGVGVAAENDPNSFNFFNDNDKFEAVMVYYHIDRMQRYIQELGFKTIVNRPIRVDPHGLCPVDNSHYVTTPQTLGKGYLAFGDGGVDDAEDAEVIAHEYGHAIQDSQAPGKFALSGQARAMGEGFGDYWAMSFYAKETKDHGHDLRCLMEWDASPLRCRRLIQLDGPKANSFNSELAEWENGQIWSGALFEIFDKLGKNIADRIILQSHFNFSGTTFKAGANAIKTADQQVFAGANKATLCKIFIDRGIYTTSDCPS